MFESCRPDQHSEPGTVQSRAPLPSKRSTPSRGMSNSRLTGPDHLLKLRRVQLTPFFLARQFFLSLNGQIMDCTRKREITRLLTDRNMMGCGL